MAPVLKLKNHDEEQVRSFELDYQASLTVEERFKMMCDASRHIKEILIRNGHRKPVEIIKRS